MVKTEGGDTHGETGGGIPMVKPLAPHREERPDVDSLYMSSVH